MAQLRMQIGLAATVLFAAACTSTNYIKPAYAPRLSTDESSLQDRVRSSTPADLMVLPFEDARETKDARYSDRKLIWKGKGIYEYRFAVDTVSDYLRKALVFDLKRFGIPAVAGDSKLDAGHSKDRPAYFLNVIVMECRPAYDSGFVSVTPEYRYEYQVKLTNAAGAEVLNRSVAEAIKGVPEPNISFATLIDRLLNDHLAAFNLKLGELLLPYVSIPAPTE